MAERDEPSLSNVGVEVAEADIADVGLAPATAALLDEDEREATVVGADLARLDDDRFRALFGGELERLRAAAGRLPSGRRAYVFGVTTDDRLAGREIDLSDGSAPGALVGARLLFAYAPAETDDGARFAHLTERLDGVDYLLLATTDGGRLDGPDTTLDGLRRELVARQARRLNLLGGDPGSYDGEFRFVLAAPLAAFERVRAAEEEF
ncbi:MAG: hypothetical protein ABEJ34_07925 [Haloferacaceae archaeon]